jgi:hypothetical protein
LLHHVQPPHLGAMCCTPGCGRVKTCLWCKSKSAETLGKPLCNTCNRRISDAAQKALKVGWCMFKPQSPC